MRQASGFSLRWWARAPRFRIAPVRTPLGDIERIEAHDPIRDGIRRGALIGAGTGGAFGLLLGIGLSCTTNCGADYSRTNDITLATVAGVLFGAGYGAGVGAVLDAAIHRRRLIYAKLGAKHVAFTPIIGTTWRGVAATVSW